MKSWGIFSLFLSLVLHVSGADLIRSISEVRELSMAEADKSYSVEFDVQVTALPFDHYGVFVHDGREGLYLSSGASHSDVLKPLQVGDHIRVRGVTESGDFSPVVVATEVEVLRHGEIEVSEVFRPSDYYASDIDCALFKLEGRFVSISVEDGDKGILVELEQDQTVLWAQLPFSTENLQLVSGLLFRQVSMPVVVNTLFNDQKQATGRNFMVVDPSQIEAIDVLPDVDNLPLLEAHEFMRFGMDHRQAIRTQGVVTYVALRELMLRGAQSSVRVILGETSEIRSGDLVELIGYVSPQSVSPAFRALSVQVHDHGATPVPIILPQDQPIDPDSNWELVQLEAKLIDLGKSFGASGREEWVLRCQNADRIFDARLPLGSVPEADLKVGATLRLTGICHLVPNPFQRGVMVLDGFWLQLGSAGDVELIKKAPWWTPKKLLWLLCALLLIVALFLVWVLVLQRVVAKQTGIIGTQVERETLLHERQRIARELHDNLEQGLVGMAIQLQGTQRVLEQSREKCAKWLKRLPSSDADAAVVDLNEGAERSRRSVQGLQAMLDQCSEEARASILYLRSSVAGRLGLLAALQEVVESLAEQAGVELEIVAEGEVYVFKQEVERNLMLVIKEAVTNAIHHGRAKKVSIRLLYKPDSFQSIIADDGSGFESACAQKSGHYGIQGMRERISLLNGVFDLRSELDEGTVVRVQLPSIQGLETR